MPGWPAATALLCLPISGARWPSLIFRSIWCSHSSSEAARQAQQPGSLVQEAIREGVLLDALP